MTAAVLWDKGILLPFPVGVLAKGDGDGKVEWRCGPKNLLNLRTTSNFLNLCWDIVRNLSCAISFASL